MNAAEKAGAEVTFLDLKEYPLPIYDGDIEESNGIPENAKKLKTILKEHQGLLIASPEYNSSFSAALKNAIDWASRPEPGEKMLECFTGKVAGIMATSPGKLGGLRGLVSLRMMLENIGIIVIPEQVALPLAHQIFESDGTLKDETVQASIDKIAVRVADILGKFAHSH